MAVAVSHWHQPHEFEFGLRLFEGLGKVAERVGQELLPSPQIGVGPVRTPGQSRALLASTIGTEGPSQGVGKEPRDPLTGNHRGLLTGVL